MAEISNSQHLREAIFATLEQTANDLKSQDNATDYAIRKRMHEMEMAIDELNWQKKQVRGYPQSLVRSVTFFTWRNRYENTRFSCSFCYLFHLKKQVREYQVLLFILLPFSLEETGTIIPGSLVRSVTFFIWRNRYDNTRFSCSFCYLLHFHSWLHRFIWNRLLTTQRASSYAYAVVSLSAGGQTHIVT